MRQGLFESDFFYLDGNFIGVALGYDYCAQHEWGFEGIKNSLDIRLGDSNYLGIEGRMIRKIPLNLSFYESKYKNKYYTNLVYKYNFISFQESLQSKPPVANRFITDFVTAWDSESFGVSVKGKRNKKSKDLENLYKSILDKKAAFCFVNKNSNNPFGRSYPLLCISDRLDSSFLKEIYEYDLNLKKLSEASESTEIENYLKQNNKSYLKLSPVWSDYIKETNDKRVIKTKYPVIYFLESSDTKKYKSGWFTVEDLKMWAHDVGPVVIDIESVSKDFIFQED